MWSPTHVQVLVKRARGLNLKGKHGTNDAFVTIGLGKEKYQTSVKEKSTENVEWCEQCELKLNEPTIPNRGNTAEIALTVLHRNFLGVDEFLGHVAIPLSDFDDVSTKPKTKWYTLQCKPGQKKTDYRGELEVRTSFTVKSVSKSSKKDRNVGASTADLGLAGSKKDKNKGSLASLKTAGNSIGGSLMSLGHKEKKNLKKLAKSVSHKVDKAGEKAKRALSKSNVNKEEEKQSSNTFAPIGSSATLPNKVNARDFDLDSAYSSGFGSKNSAFQRVGSGRNRDPGVQSDEEDDDFKFDALSVSHRSSGSSLNVGNLGLVSKTSTPISGSLEDTTNVAQSDQLFRKSFGTPVNARKEPTPSLTPRTSRSFLVETSGSLKRRSLDKKHKQQDDEPVLDEWEAKLLGKKSAVPYKSPESLMVKDSHKAAPDSLSIVSQASSTTNNNTINAASSKKPLSDAGIATSQQSSSRQTLQPQETPQGRKKKIIPVGSDFESSPSPESPRYNSAAYTESLPGRGFGSRESSFRTSSRALDQESLGGGVEYEEKKKKGIGLKLKSSYKNLKDSGRTTSLFNLSSLGKGFKDKDDASSKRLGASTRDLRISSESLSFQQQHSRNHSDGSGVLPPSGLREGPLGREKTPTPGGGNLIFSEHQQRLLEEDAMGPKRISRETWERYEGKTREELIETILQLQASVEKHAKKQSDMEDYIDGLLMKVMMNAPNLLQKNANLDKKYGTYIK